MPRGVIWYLAGSPVMPLLAGLPDDLDPRPLLARDAPATGPEDGAVLLVDLGGGGDSGTVADAAARLSGVPIVALVEAAAQDAPAQACYAYLTKPVTPFILATALRNAREHARLGREAGEARRQLEEVNAIGVRLSAERDTDALLELILTKTREITRSDAGSLYLVESEDGQRRLRFKLAQNDSVTVPFTEFTLPISEDSVAGHVALSGETVHLDDAYILPAGARFRINRDFDQRVGYRTKSMLVVAMRTPPGETIGVLQLINCKREGIRRLASPETAGAEVLPYPARFRDLAASLASQAAVALENSRLYQSIQTLFEGFVRASVTAIESRDPATSGHSFRVADLTVALATAVDRADHGPFGHVRFAPDEMKEIRYASLLHDFGKVGVREELLVKAKKFQPWHLELVRLRGEIIKRGLELKYARHKLDHLLREGRAGFVEAAAGWDAELLAVSEEVQQHLKTVAAANEPAVMPEDFAASIRDLATRAFVDHLGDSHTVITPEEARILSIPRGTLTEDEYRQIQSHVGHTFQFLSQIPWTKELSRVPEIARAHHEKLDGSGYPERRRGAEIPIQSRMMTIADIFDALAAADRPYKPAVSVERALDILNHERQSGALDPALLDLFIAIKPWQQPGAR